MVDLVEDSLNEDTFFSVARSILDSMFSVAADSNRKMTLRALAVSVLRGCFDIMDMVKDEHGQEVRGFAEEVLGIWSPLFIDTLRLPFPRRESIGENGFAQEPESWRGFVALKLQVVKTLAKIKMVFPQLLLPLSTVLFKATWDELTKLQVAYKELYADNNGQSRLEDADNLPYSLDFLVLEELDFFQTIIRAPPVKEELEAAIRAQGAVGSTSWLVDLIQLATTYAQVTCEEEELWEIDVNLFLAEETSVTANYTARTACGDLLIKLGEWLNQGALEGLLSVTQTLFDTLDGPWKMKEASLYLLTQLCNDFLDVDKHIPVELSLAYLKFIDNAIRQEDGHLLRARGYLVAGVLVQAVDAGESRFPKVDLLSSTIEAVAREEEEVVKIACIKAIQGYLKGGVEADMVSIQNALSDYLASKDLTDLEGSDDTLVTLVETLRLAIQLNFGQAVSDNTHMIDLLFLLAKHGTSSFQLTMLVTETFEEIVEAMADEGTESYINVCRKVLPSLTGALDVGNMTGDGSLTTVSVLFPSNTRQLLTVYSWFVIYLPFSSTRVVTHFHQDL